MNAEETRLRTLEQKFTRAMDRIAQLEARPVSPSMHLGANDADPLLPSDGHIWYRTDSDQLRARLDGKTHAVRTTTRTIPIYSFDENQADGHGTLNANLQTLHVHFADAATTFNRFKTFKLPDDGLSALSGTWTIKWMWSSSVASNDVRFGTVLSVHSDGDTANTNVLNTAAAFAAPGVADTMEVSSITFSSTPAAGGIFSGYVRRDGSNAADTNTGTVSVWAVWLEYQQSLT